MLEKFLEFNNSKDPKTMSGLNSASGLIDIRSGLRGRLYWYSLRPMCLYFPGSTHNNHGRVIEIVQTDPKKKPEKIVVEYLVHRVHGLVAREYELEIPENVEYLDPEKVYQDYNDGTGTSSQNNPNTRALEIDQTKDYITVFPQGSIMIFKGGDHWIYFNEASIPEVKPPGYFQPKSGYFKFPGTVDVPTPVPDLPDGYTGFVYWDDAILDAMNNHINRRAVMSITYSVPGDTNSMPSFITLRETGSSSATGKYLMVIPKSVKNMAPQRDAVYLDYNKDSGVNLYPESKVRFTELTEGESGIVTFPGLQGGGVMLFKGFNYLYIPAWRDYKVEQGLLLNSGNKGLLEFAPSTQGHGIPAETEVKPVPEVTEIGLLSFFDTVLGSPNGEVPKDKVFIERAYPTGFVRGYSETGEELRNINSKSDVLEYFTATVRDSGKNIIGRYKVVIDPSEAGYPKSTLTNYHSDFLASGSLGSSILNPHANPSESQYAARSIKYPSGYDKKISYFPLGDGRLLLVKREGFIENWAVLDVKARLNIYIGKFLPLGSGPIDFEYHAPAVPDNPSGGTETEKVDYSHIQSLYQPNTTYGEKLDMFQFSQEVIRSGDTYVKDNRMAVCGMDLSFGGDGAIPTSIYLINENTRQTYQLEVRSGEASEFSWSDAKADYEMGGKEEVKGSLRNCKIVTDGRFNFSVSPNGDLLLINVTSGQVMRALIPRQNSEPNMIMTSLSSYDTYEINTPSKHQ